MSAVNMKSFNGAVQMNSVQSVSPNYFTDVKVKRAALYVLSASLIVASAALIAASVSGLVTWPLAFIAIPFVAAAAGIIKWTKTFKDYEDPRELQSMRDQAFQNSFSQIIYDHGLDKIQKHQIVSQEVLQQKFIKEYEFSSFSNLIQKYSLQTIRTNDLMPLETLQKKFAQEIQRMGISSFLRTFSLSDLQQHQILSQKQFPIIYSLCNRAQIENEELRSAKIGLDHKYPGRQERLLAQLDEEESFARHNAYRLKSEMASQARMAGYMTTEMMAAPSYGRNTPQARYDRMHTRNNGMLLTELAAVPMVESMSDRMLSSELEGIQRRRQSIIDRRAGEVEQMNYLQELSRLDSAHTAKFQGFDREFKTIQDAIVKEAKL